MLIRRKYYDAEPIYVREAMPNWYQQLPATNAEMQRILANFVPGRDALEIGCGGGWLGHFLLTKKAKSYVGFDFSETAIAHAQKRLARFRNAKVFVGNALDLASYPNGPDLIVAHQFPQCLIGEDRLVWLRHARQVIRPESGVLALSTVIGIPSGIAPVVDIKTRINHLRNRYFADDAEIRRELERTGFTLLDVMQPEENMAIYLAKPEV